MAAAFIGDKVFFAGGSYYTGDYFSNRVWDVSDVVDIYNLSTNSWSVHILSVARADIISFVIGDKIYFVGGYDRSFSAGFSNVADIYDNSTGTWSTSNLQTVVASLPLPAGMGTIDRLNKLGDNILFWSGDQVGIRNLSTGSTSIACNYYSKTAYYINDKILFFDATNQIKLYDPATGIWSKGAPHPAIPAGIKYSVIQLNNSLYLAGGIVTGSNNQSECVFSNAVYKLSW